MSGVLSYAGKSQSPKSRTFLRCQGLDKIGVERLKREMKPERFERNQKGIGIEAASRTPKHPSRLRQFAI